MAVPEGDHLFQTQDIESYLQRRRTTALGFVETVPAATLTSVSEDELAKTIATNHTCDPVVLHYDRAYQDHAETYMSVDEIHDGSFRYPFADENTRIPATRYLLHVPYEGDLNLFSCRGRTYWSSVPKATVHRDEIVFTRRVHEQEATENLKAEFERAYRLVEEAIRGLNAEVERFNRELVVAVKATIEARRAKLKKTSDVAAAMGYPMRRRPDAPQTYSVSLPRKQIAMPTPPVGPARPHQPELAMKDYEDVLRIIESMALMLERSPHAFSQLEEEALRFFFLVYLNGQYEGRATGETFNYSGKTDILVNDQGKTIFIAECKFWSGPSGFSETIDQLFGYLSWRDTKAAILVFNHDRQMSTVVGQIADLLAGHKQAKGSTSTLGDSKFRATFRHPEDAEREVLVTVLVFNVPRKNPKAPSATPTAETSSTPPQAEPQTPAPARSPPARRRRGRKRSGTR